MGFNLADVLANVSGPDTSREQIQYIPLSQIDSDENNFYQLSGVEDLAANIATVGLQQPIRVRVNPDDPLRYLTVSGHRRRAALELLQADGPEKWSEVPCIVETDDVSPSLQQLRLIYANANTRVMTSAEIGEQAAQVEKLLYQLKEEGYEFPGRMRDHVAEAVGASKTQWGGDCTCCCLQCPDIIHCGSCCSYALPRKQEMRETTKKANAAARQREAERVAPRLDQIRDIYRRVGQARAAAGISVEQLNKAIGIGYSAPIEKEQIERETNPETITSEHTHIFGHIIHISEISAMVNVADLLGVSLDWLLGREDFQPTNVSSPDTWQPGNPPTGGTYAVVLSIKATGGTTVDEAAWNGEQWHIWGAPLDEDELAVTHWAEFPGQTPSPLNHSCKTGMSPTGHCGSAAYCDSEANCCLNCDEPCNSRCGWVEISEDLTDE